MPKILKKPYVYVGAVLLAIAMSCSPKGLEIKQRPIQFDEERRTLTRAYLKDRYGIEQEDERIEPRMVVLHWTAIPTLQESFEAFYPSRLPGIRSDIQSAGSLNVSAHYLIDRDGQIYQLMPDTLMARHVIGLNHCAIGIENVGGTEDTPLTEAQLRSNIELVRQLAFKYPIQYLIGHHEYTSFEGHPLWKERDSSYRTEKTDPGMEFMSKVRHKVKDLSLEGPPQ